MPKRKKSGKIRKGFKREGVRVLSGKKKRFPPKRN